MSHPTTAMSSGTTAAELFSTCTSSSSSPPSSALPLAHPLPTPYLPTSSALSLGQQDEVDAGVPRLLKGRPPGQGCPSGAAACTPNHQQDKVRTLNGPPWSGHLQHHHRDAAPLVNLCTLHGSDQMEPQWT